MAIGLSGYCLLVSSSDRGYVDNLRLLCGSLINTILCVIFLFMEIKQQVLLVTMH